MKILVVSSYPPTHCGIGSYAAQQVSTLREAGHSVEVASLDGHGDTDHRFMLKRSADLARLAILARRFDRVLIHYHHDFFFDGLDRRQLIVHNTLLSGLFKLRGVEIVCHEINFALLEGGVGRAIRFSEAMKWRASSRLWMHTAYEADRLLKLIPRAQVSIREHSSDFRAFSSLDKAAAREQLDLPPEAKLFLCIGFLQRHKGFDRAIEAFQGVTSPDARLYIVGSARIDDEETRHYITQLLDMAKADSRVHIVESFVSDSVFDTWLLASDAVVIPYREIWSSGVTARARLLQRPVIAAVVGGLGDQLTPNDRSFVSNADLSQALEEIAGGVKRLSPTQRADRLRLAVVMPWYAGDMRGGAEGIMREVTERLAARGANVRVLTTALQGYESDWSKNARPLDETVNGIPVRRFPVEPRLRELFEPVNAKVCRGEPVSDAERDVFEQQMIRCPELEGAVLASRDEVDLFLIGPYMFATTLQAARAAGDKAVLIPCLHDEGYARLPSYAEMFRRARGILFKSEPERDLAERLYGLAPDRTAVVGDGLVTDWSADRQAFARRHGLSEYFLYVGRKEEGKNFPLLLECFRAYVRSRPEARLVLLGPGRFESQAGDNQILDLGFVSEKEKQAALTGAIALIQPSRLEAFSLSCMESWLARRPVLVARACAVTRYHVRKSGGGLTFDSATEFAAACDELANYPSLSAEMGIRGRRYVVDNYEWPLVIDRYIAAMEQFSRLEVPLPHARWVA